MILFGVPAAVQRFFAPVTAAVSRPLRRAIPAMVLALLLAPHRRCLKTLAGVVLGRRNHASTISRRLRNANWRTWDWYVCLYQHTLAAVDRYERQWAAAQRGEPARHWMAIVDTTYHATHAEVMENVLTFNRRQNPNSRATRHHAFVLGMVLTDTGARIPLPRRSYYTRDYCQRHGRRYRTQVELAAALLRDLVVPAGVAVTAVYDSAFDADDIHRVCRHRHFREVFPLDPNRTFAAGPDADASGVPGQKVVGWTRSWGREQFTLVALQHANEAHGFMRRRHRDNLRLRKTTRRYAVASQPATVSGLGACLVVASYKENPRVQLLAGESADWYAYHQAQRPPRKQQRWVPQRWHGKVLACTDTTASARQVVEWYEVRWQIELFFRELKSRMQFGCYVLQKFEAVERYVDLILLGMLLLEQERLREMEQNQRRPRVGEANVQARTTDRLRCLESQCQEWNIGVLEQALRTEAGRRRFIRRLRAAVPAHVA